MAGALAHFARVACAVLALSGCDGERANVPVVQPEAASTPSNPPQAWLGRWNGPEGTYLELRAGTGAAVEVVVRNLDGARSFQGVVGDGRVQFERDGQLESIQATDGPATGMKWLADKTTCLTVRPGEGYCRD